MANNLNDISRIYLDQIANINKKEVDKDVERWTQTEAVKGQDSEMRRIKASERGTDADTRNPDDPTGKNYATGKRADVAWWKKKSQKESFSDWRTDLREVIDEPITDTEDLKKVDVKKGIKNKVIINPKLTEAISELGGQLLEVTETEEEPKEDPQLTQKSKRQTQLKKQVLMRKLTAVRQGGGEDIVASYDPLEDAIEYFYEEGINEEGFDQLIEEIGLDEFVDFIDGGVVELTEEREARRATVRAKKYDVVKKEVDKADAARKKAKKGEYAPSYAKKETDVTVYDDKPAAKKKAPAKKTVVKKAAPKPVAKKPVTKKVEKAVAKVKKTQPVKKATKQGLGDRIRSAYKAGVKRHRKATQAPRVFAKGVKSGASKAVKFVKDVHKAVNEEVVLEKDLNAAERRALPNKDFVFPGKGEGPEGKQRGAYPINDKKHARAALAMAAAHASPEKEAKVKAAVKKKYPDIEVSEAKVDKGRSDYGKATIRNWRRSGPSTVDPAMFDPENKRGKTIDKRREEHKARRGVKGAKVPTYTKEEVIDEEGYDRMRDDRLVKYGIGHDGSDKSGPSPRSTGKQPKGDTVYQKEMKKKYGGKLPSALQVVTDKIRARHGKGAIADVK